MSDCPRCAEKPILFSTEMVQVILEGRKTQTRRPIKPQPPNDIGQIYGPEFYNPSVIDKNGELQPGSPVYGAYDESGEWGAKCPYQVGDILYVRETWKHYEKATGKGENFRIKQFLAYKVDEDNDSIQKSSEWYEGKWRPSIHMPRKAARLFLKVTDVRVERLWDITEAGVMAEGFNIYLSFYNTWDSVYSKRGYGFNIDPWVWVISFERVNVDE